MTTDEKGLQDALIHHLKNGKGLPKNIIDKIRKIVDWKRVSLIDRDVSGPQIFDLCKDGYEEFVTQKESLRKNNCLCIEECMYLVKYKKEDVPLK